MKLPLATVALGSLCVMASRTDQTPLIQSSPQTPEAWKNVKVQIGNITEPLSSFNKTQPLYIYDRDLKELSLKDIESSDQLNCSGAHFVKFTVDLTRDVLICKENFKTLKDEQITEVIFKGLEKGQYEFEGYIEMARNKGTTPSIYKKTTQSQQSQPQPQQPQPVQPQQPQQQLYQQSQAQQQ